MRLLAWALCVLSASVSASSLPNNLQPSDAAQIVAALGPAGALRFLRSAEALPSWPGIKVGVDLFLVPSSNVNGLGSGDGSLSTIAPVPRLYLAKGLFADIDLVVEYLPASLFNTLSTLGVGLKWTLVDEREQWFSAATYAGVTKLDGYNSAYQGTDVEVGMVASKDYTRARPYLGLGLLIVGGSLPNPFSPGTFYTANAVAVHSYFGVEFELPLTLTLQFDVMNLSPMGSLFFGKRF